MITAVSPYLDTIKSIKSGIFIEAERIIKENEREILNYLRYDQLFDKGIDGTGKKMKPYVESTKRLKRKTGLPSDRRTHFQTGKHYQNFYTEVRKKTLEILSNTRAKNGFDLGEYLNLNNGGRVYELTKENNDKINDEIIFPKLIEWVYNQLIS
ncbi:hypothetical protein [Aquimarina sp. 2201CG5-10]|uniref:hypothetical protein n=1 Tax=Aquimarina callyspongiae TaxID=3098150 RepID=UPI002AB33575|nr:hypothetical protein [Aquimarina sp. 2201CG5-10]MDY8137561.1 hypothetical protein [Aquimarina sp. 2201CG5-10]